jgi:hypothetical protein
MHFLLGRFRDARLTFSRTPSFAALDGCKIVSPYVHVLMIHFDFTTRRHFHADHYMGLSGSFVHGPIYASQITCNLIRLKFPRVPERLLFILPDTGSVLIQDVRVTTWDANQ